MTPLNFVLPGTGVEAGAGIHYSAGAFSIEGQVHTLIAHEDSGYEDWGASGALRVNPSPSGRGLSLTLRVIHASFKAVERFIT